MQRLHAQNIRGFSFCLAKAWCVLDFMLSPLSTRKVSFLGEKNHVSMKTEKWLKVTMSTEKILRTTGLLF